MAHSPSNSPARRLTLFGQELAGTLRRASVVDLLFRHLREALAPTETVAALMDGDSVSANLVRTWPDERPGRAVLLKLAELRGPLFVRSSLTTVLHEAGLTPLPDVSGTWMIVPLVAKGRVTGAVAVRAPEGQYDADDLALLEGLASLANVALESARLVDLHDESQRSWQEVVDAIAPALCVVDRAGRIRRANRAFADLVGAPPASLIARPWIAFVPPEWTPELQRALSPQFANREVELRTFDRSYFVTAVPIAGAYRPATVLQFEDHTDRRRLQDQLVQSEKMSAIGQLIAGIAHDLNNPLASVVGFADFLTEMREVPPAIREPLTVIQEEAERASKIVKNLLGFARKQEHRRRSTEVQPLLDATLALLRNELMATRVEPRLEVESDLPPIDIDPVQIQQVFVNIITNAAQAIVSTGHPGTVVIRARRYLDGVAVEIIDDGPGMPESLAEQIFEPFFTTKPEGEGTGLGLSISQGIVKEHGGRILLSTKEGRGSIFTIQLPLGGRATTSESQTAARPTQSSLKVLVVDDEPHILHYMRATLDAWGHVVAVAHDGEEALARVADEPFDLVICDLRMPKVGGREFYEEARRRNPAMASRIIFATGDTVRGDTLAFLESLDRPYLHKPFSLAELRALLQAVARESGPHLARRDSGNFLVDAAPGL